MDPEAVARLAGERVPHGSSDDPDLVDFSANTNPRAPDGTREVYADAFDAARSYPDDGYPAYRRAAAGFVGCDPDRVVPTPGGLAAIRLAAGAFVDAGDRGLVPRPTFGEYERELRLQGATVERVAHDAALDHDPEPYAVVVVCNPNNPTGDAYDADALRAYARRCRAAETVLLVDEAFLGFTDRPSLAGADGAVVARSLTKLFGLPGLRAGFSVATGDRRERLAAARRTWSLSVPAARVGRYCLEQEAFVQETRERVATERDRLADRLSDGFEVYAPPAPTGSLSAANAPFLLLDAGESERVDGALAAAREAGIALRDARTFVGLDSHVRVAVRLPAENDRLCEVLAGV